MLENIGFKLNNISHISGISQRNIQPVKNIFFKKSRRSFGTPQREEKGDLESNLSRLFRYKYILLE